jgi:hypothetical protein
MVNLRYLSKNPIFRWFGRISPLANDEIVATEVVVVFSPGLIWINDRKQGNPKIQAN